MLSNNSIDDGRSLQGWFEVGSGIVMVFEAPGWWRMDEDAMTPNSFHRLGTRMSAVGIPATAPGESSGEGRRRR